MKKTAFVKMTLQEGVDPAVLYGSHDCHIQILEKAFGVKVGGRGGILIIEGERDPVAQVQKVISHLASLSQQGLYLDTEEVYRAIQAVQPDLPSSLDSADPKTGEASRKATVSILGKRKSIAPKSQAQEAYITAIRAHDLVVGIGPAGTGKTYLAMAMALSSLLSREAYRIILTRPAVEAGEKLGFLPGDMMEKVNPYLRPLYDALYDMIDVDRAHRLLDRGEIEIAPLAFMRGRTLNDSFIVLDEAQNTTSEQMKMFLTRMGFRSKAVITGDITQVDLPSGCLSGLIEIQDVLKDVPGLQFVYFSEKDVVRHRLVQEIVKAYERSSKKGNAV